ncbi:hypothetical protein AVEN_116005-1 [Araneus ventricosus]|uniref:Uncharacterized protein n=1 Tax=Araneus ventricosus TaxID=182803 RepID=A0A4Y2EL19_ARAVE|nr:hypothetical protein AVEN_116005-1 [Araneus ventricosus]
MLICGFSILAIVALLGYLFCTSPAHLQCHRFWDIIGRVATLVSSCYTAALLGVFPAPKCLLIKLPLEPWYIWKMFSLKNWRKGEDHPVLELDNRLKNTAIQVLQADQTRNEIPSMPPHSNILRTLSQRTTVQINQFNN